MRAKRLRISLLTIGLLGFGSAEALASTIQYEDLPRLIQQKNGEVLSAGEIVGAAKARTGSLERSFLPRVDINGGVEHFKTRDFPQATQPFGGVDLKVNVFRGGQDLLGEQGRDAELVIAKANERLTYREELLLARNLYWELAYLKGWIASLRKALAKNAESRKEVARVVSKGLSSDTDLIGFDLFNSQIKEMIDSTRRELKILERKLKVRIGVDPDEPIKIASRIPHTHDDELLGATFEGPHPAVEGLRGEAKRDRIDGKSWSRWWTPEVDAFGQYQLYTERERDLFGIKERQDLAGGVRLTMNLFDGLQSHHEAKSAKQKAAAKEKRADYESRKLQTDLVTGQEGLRRLHRLIHASERFVRQSRLWLEKTQKDYSLGLKNSQELIDVIEKTMELAKQNLQYQRDYQILKAKVQSLVED